MPPNRRVRIGSRKFGKLPWLQAAKLAANTIGNAYAAYSRGRNAKNMARVPKRAMNFPSTNRRKRPRRNAPTARTFNKTLVSNGNGMTNSRTIKRYKPMNGYNLALKLAYKDIQFLNSKGDHLCNYGTQAAFELGTYLNNEDIERIWLRSIATTPGFQAIATATTTDRDRKIWLDSYEAKTMISNSGASTIVIHIWDLYCKETKDLLRSDPIPMWEQGLTQTLGIGIAGTSRLAWPSLPTDSSLFNRQWGIIKKTKVELHSGRCHEHNFNVSYKGLLPKSKAQRDFQEGTQYNYKGLTTKTIVFFHGVPATAENDFVATNLVTLDRAKIAYVTAERYHTRVVNVKGKLVTYNNSLPMEDNSYSQQNPDGQGTHASNSATGVNTSNTWS